MKVAVGDEDEEDAVVKKLFIEALAIHLSVSFPKEKPNCQYIAKEYYKFQVRPITYLSKLTPRSKLK